MTELAAQPIRRATSFKENFAPSSFSARLRRSESSSAEPFGRMGTSYRQEVHYCIILCEINNATVSDIMDTKQVQDLPLNGRNPLSLLTLEPGVVQRTTNGAGSGTHVFGSRDRSHNVTIDGIDANESTVPNPQANIQRLNPDNVQEFRTVT